MHPGIHVCSVRLEFWIQTQIHVIIPLRYFFFCMLKSVRVHISVCSTLAYPLPHACPLALCSRTSGLGRRIFHSTSAKRFARPFSCVSMTALGTISFMRRFWRACKSGSHYSGEWYAHTTHTYRRTLFIVYWYLREKYARENIRICAKHAFETTRKICTFLHILICACSLSCFLVWPPSVPWRLPPFELLEHIGHPQGHPTTGPWPFQLQLYLPL